MLEPILKAPLLLATDGSASARFAQQLLYPLRTILAHQPEQPWLVVLTVKPRLLPQAGRKAAEPLLVNPVATPTGPEVRPLAEPQVTPAAVPKPTDPGADAADLTAEQQLLRQLATEIPADTPFALEIRRGRPGSEILNEARVRHAGLIAVGDQGVAMGLRDFVLGSVSTAVAQYAPGHVLIARGQPQLANWRHLLLVLDGSLATPQAIALTRQLVPVGVEKVTILSILPPLTTQYLFGPFATPTPSWQLMQSLQSAQQEQSQQMLSQALTVLRNCNLQLQMLEQVSEPGNTICQIAEHHQVGMIILGSDRRRPLGNVHLSATGNYVIHHAPCPVLLCRSPRIGASEGK